MSINSGNEPKRRPLMSINSVCLTTCVDAANITAGNNVADALERNINVSHVQTTRAKHSNLTYKPTNVSQVSFAETTSGLGNVHSLRKKQVDSKTLAKRWNIDPRKALNTVKQTTQKALRTTLYPSLSRHYPTNDRMLRYNRLPHPVFSDTMQAGVTSKRGNKYAQAYCTQYGWTRCHPMKTKSGAHETLSLHSSGTAYRQNFLLTTPRSNLWARLPRNAEKLTAT